MRIPGRLNFIFYVIYCLNKIRFSQIAQTFCIRIMSVLSPNARCVPFIGHRSITLVSLSPIAKMCCFRYAIVFSIINTIKLQKYTFATCEDESKILSNLIILITLKRKEQPWRTPSHVL